MEKVTRFLWKANMFYAIPLTSCSDYLNGKSRYNKFGPLGGLREKEDMHVVE
jgi:hypothetical protein